MNFIGFDYFPFKLQVAGRTSILDNRAGKTKIKCCSCCRIYTHMAHRATKNNSLDSCCLQLFMKFRTPESIGIILFNHVFSIQWRYGLVDFRTFRPRQEKGRARTCRYMSKVEYRELKLTNFPQNRSRVLSGTFHPNKLHLPARKIIILDIYQYESIVHTSIPLQRSLPLRAVSLSA